MNKIKAVVVDLTGDALEWLDNFGNEDHLELCELLKLRDDDPIAIWDLKDYENWDFLLVFERGVTERVHRILKMSGIADDRIIYPHDLEGSMCDNRGLCYYIFNEKIHKIIDYVSHRRAGERYTTVHVSGLTYVNVVSDNTILPGMLNTQENWAQKDMEFFYKLSNEYYSFDKGQDIFCDIGANIGTTCIYFKKKIDKDITIMAFEPSAENYKILQTNAILNDIDLSKHWFVNMGLSDVSGEAVINYNPENPGGSSFVSSDAGIKERVTTISFDEYVIQKSIDINKIKYIWIDVEGFEARFFAGAVNTLSKIKVPVIMEFIPKFYIEKEGEFDLLINELKKHFDSYIILDQSEKGRFPIDDLRKEQNNSSLEWDLFLLG